MSGGGEDANEVIFKRRYILRKWFQKQETFYGSSKIIISHWKRDYTLILHSCLAQREFNHTYQKHFTHSLWKSNILISCEKLKQSQNDLKITKRMTTVNKANYNGLRALTMSIIHEQNQKLSFGSLICLANFWWLKDLRVYKLVVFTRFWI